MTTPAGTDPESGATAAAMVASDGLKNIKQEPGTERLPQQQSSKSTAIPLFPKPSLQSTGSSVASSGAPLSQAAAAAAVAMPSGSVGSGTGNAPMFNGFGGVGGFFNAAAFAAAAAAAFPNAGVTSKSLGKDNNSWLGLASKPGGLASKPGGLASKPGGLASKPGGSTSQSTSAIKRRKRCRAEESSSDVKPREASPMAGGVAPQPASLLLSKVEAVCPQQSHAITPAEGISSAASAVAGAASGGGTDTSMAWANGMMNVLAPNPFEGEISTQERKVSEGTPPMGYRTGVFSSFRSHQK